MVGEAAFYSCKGWGSFKGQESQEFRKHTKVFSLNFSRGSQVLLGVALPLLWGSCKLVLWICLGGGWTKMTPSGRNFTRLVNYNEMMMSLGVNNRSAQHPLGLTPIWPGSMFCTGFPRNSQFLNVFDWLLRIGTFPPRVTLLSLGMNKTYQNYTGSESCKSHKVLFQGSRDSDNSGK